MQWAYYNQLQNWLISLEILQGTPWLQTDLPLLKEMLLMKTLSADVPSRCTLEKRPIKCSMPQFKTFTQALLVTNIRTQGIENEEKCSSRFPPDECELKLNHFSQKHDAHCRP